MPGEETRVCLLSEPDSIGFARTLVREAAAGLESGMVEDAVLLTSELVTNAVRHGGDHIELVADADGDQVTVAVHDDGNTFPPDGHAAAPREVTATSGRGLGMVHRVARSWGVEDDVDGPGKTVWFRLDGRIEAGTLQRRTMESEG